MGGSSAEKNAVFEFLHFGETSSAASEISPGGRNYGGRNPPSFAGSTAGPGRATRVAITTWRWRTRMAVLALIRWRKAALISETVALRDLFTI
jgi:hypothetical protein